MLRRVSWKDPNHCSLIQDHLEMHHRLLGNPSFHQAPGNLWSMVPVREDFMVLGASHDSMVQAVSRGSTVLGTSHVTMVMMSLLTAHVAVGRCSTAAGLLVTLRLINVGMHRTKDIGSLRTTGVGNRRLRVVDGRRSKTVVSRLSMAEEEEDRDMIRIGGVHLLKCAEEEEALTRGCRGTRNTAVISDVVVVVAAGVSEG